MKGEMFWVWVFLAPTLFGLLFGTLGPVLGAIGISFTDWDVITPPIFAGLDNYKKLIDDPTFSKALVNTLYYVGIMVPVSTALSLFFAFLLNQKLRGVTWYRTAYFLPVVSSTVAVALVWSWIYAKDFGLLNYMLRQVGASTRWLAQQHDVGDARGDHDGYLGKSGCGDHHFSGRAASHPRVLL